MRWHIASLVLIAVACVASAVTGVRYYEAGSTKTVIEYWHGYERLYAVGLAIFFAAAAYALYRRVPLAWKLGLIGVYAGMTVFVFLAWWHLWPQDGGWVGACAITIVAPFIAFREARQWQKYRSSFFPHEDEQT